jgi:hypothetical protein
MASSDPRERLVELGQQILDLAYNMEIASMQLEEDRIKVKDHLTNLGLVRDGEAVVEISSNTPSPDGLDLKDFSMRTIEFMRMQSERHHAMIEYVALRRALEYIPLDMDAALSALMSDEGDAIEASAEEGKDK